MFLRKRILRPLPAPALPRAALILGFVLLAGLAAGAETPLDFSRDVLPILSDACFRCHGPDGGTRKGKELRLDTYEGLYRTRAGISVVMPGAPDESELVVRISSDLEDEVMPPADAVRKLTPTEIKTLRRWVSDGAPWSRHWAFRPVGNPVPLPATVSPIDSFINARITSAGMVPSPESDRARLLRRVTLDLTGLPPTPAEVTHFLADDQGDAYERAVDRLLSSPRFGERMATEWLDVARFADTHGYQIDSPRAMWAWRDWVIKSFNDNLPFDQFALWQLAGDLLPNPTKQQRLATGFNRLHNQNEEGGVIPEEYRVSYVADRVGTFGTAFLGLTFDCARCHDHKFDPITQKDYYSLFAFFQNVDEAGQVAYAKFNGPLPAVPLPTMLITTDEDDQKVEALRSAVKEAETDLTHEREQSRAAFDAWLATRVHPLGALDGLIAQYALDKLVDGAVVNSVDDCLLGKPVDAPNIVTGPANAFAELNGENGFEFPGLGNFKRTDSFSLGLWLQTPVKQTPRAVVLHHTRTPGDSGRHGYDLILNEGRVAFGLHYLWPGGSLEVVTKVRVPADEWAHVAVSYDGSSRPSGVHIYINGREAELEIVRDTLFKDISYTRDNPPVILGFRTRDSGFAGGRVRDFNLFSRELTSIEVAHLAGRADLIDAWAAKPEALLARQREDLFRFFIANVHPTTRELATRLRERREAENVFVTRLPEAMVMQELPEPRKAYILERGAYDMRGAEVTADTPGFLPPFPKNESRNRLGLARWLVSKDNPLMARVTVNRLWQMMFGRGIVETSENFGAQGSPPSHPELLDWLACDFVSSGWDVKRTLRQIVCSAVYRRSSMGSPEAVTADGSNALLARAPVRRLTAEMIRDQALAAAGLLVAKVGGPSVKPWQPPGLWEEIASGKPTYEVGTGDDLYRRSLYTFWKRTVPPPTMMLFDSAGRNNCTVRRQSTSTPLQALALLNDQQFLEASRYIGYRMLKEGGQTIDEQLAWGFLLVTGRKVAKRELAILRQAYAEQRAIFAADLGAASKFDLVGASKSDDSLPLVERAAMAMVANTLLNFDESLIRR